MAGDLRVRAAPLLERDAEMVALVSALDSARAGAGSVVLVEGPPGVGKTALLDAARERAGADGMHVIQARATELERDFPFGVVQQCLEPVVRGAEGIRLLTGAAKLAEPVLLGSAQGAATPAAGLLHGLYWLVANLSQDATLAIIVDDGHWADEASLLFLAYLARRVDSLPVALLLGARRDESVPATRGLTEVRALAGRRRLEPRPLGRDGVAQMLRAASDEPVDETFAAACEAATGGNPFLLDELIRALESEQVPFTAAGAERVTTIAPVSVVDAVSATLERLGTVPAALADAAAVLGDGSSLELAAALAGVPMDTAPAAAASLVKAGLLQDVPELRFRHPILAGAVPARRSAHERAKAHAAAATLLRARGAGPERVALQLLHAAPAGDADVVAELERAAEHAQQRGAPATAALLLERALDEPPAEQARAELLTGLGRAELLLGRGQDGVAHVLEGYRCARDASTRARAVALLAMDPGEPTTRGLIVELAEETLPALAPEDQELALRLRALLALEGRLHELPHLTGATTAEAAFLGHLVFARMRPDARAADIAELADRGSRQVDALLAEGATWLGFTGIVLGLQWAERLDDAERLLDRAIAAARRAGSVADFASAMTLRAQVRRRAGRLRHAEADARVAREAVLEPGWWFARGLAPLVCTLVEQGLPHDAAEALAEVMGTDDIPESPPMLPVLLARMRLREALREHPAALADWEEALRRVEPRGANAGWIEDFAVAVDVHLALGRDDAADVAARAGEIADAWGTPGARGTALHAAARARGADIELLRAAVEQLVASPLRVEEARSRVSLGAALRRAGHRVESRAPLREGYELAHRCGAAGLAEIARAELAATGIRLQREPASGVEALTPSERRIAELAASGMSNPEIAQELFLTVKTIEMHLTRVYRKLDVRGRSQLAGALGIED